MTFEHWDRLLFGIERGECILFLGPELPLVLPDGKTRIPAAELAKRLRGEDGDDSLAKAAQRFVAAEDEVALELAVKRWHDELDGVRSTLHDDLAALPFRRIVTSSHDPLMATALREAGKEPHVAYYHYRGSREELLPEASAASPVVYHLYGHPREPRSVVLTQTQLLDFLTALISRDPPLPNDLNAALTEGRLFLFLGFGLRRWYLRILLHVLKVLGSRSRAFAFEDLENGDPAAARAILFYRENFKVDVHHDDVADFVAELRRRFKPSGDEAGDSAPVAGAVPVRAPKVFICHASEDHVKAREVHDTLRRSGLEPWLDRESLRGGDRWDALIESTIKGVDFFVVLNSRALREKSQRASYVNKEIKTAKKAEEWRFGSFIVPVRIDDAPLLEHLDDYHAIDLGQADGMTRLVRAIKRQVGAR